MRKKTTALFAAILTAGLAGCSLVGDNYREILQYDLRLDTEKNAKKIDLPEVRIGAFSDLSGSGRRFAYREGETRLQSDDYRMWLLNPDAMLRREFQTAFHREGTLAGNGVFWHLSVTITRFEFDRTGKNAKLGLDYKLEEFSGRKPGRIISAFREFTSPCADTSADTEAAAMKVCAQQALDAIRSAMLEMKKNK